MIRPLLFFAGYLLLVPLGAPAAFHPSIRGLPLAARAAAALAAGAVALTVEAMVLSMLRIPWSVATLGLPLLAVSLWLSRRWARPFSPEPALARSAAVAGIAALAAGLAVTHLGLSLATARATSPDFLLFWGVKGARFAAARGFDAKLLRSFFSYHLVPDYPPLVPAIFSWGVLLGGDMPWRSAPVTAALWLVAAVPLVAGFLRRRLSEDHAAAVAAFWAVALAISLAHSDSGGSAEAPLLFFETAALAALLAERPEEPAPSRFFPALALAGAALTKVEGSAAVFFILLGVLARDLLERRPRAFQRLFPLALAPVLALGAWFAFQAVSGLEVGYRAHGDLRVLYPEHLPAIGRAFLRHLQAGTWGLSWIVPLALLLLGGRRPRVVLPAITLAGGLLIFFAVDYLHDAADPSMRIHWTLPRVSQPCLSALILAAGFATASRPEQPDASSGGKRSEE